MTDFTDATEENLLLLARSEDISVIKSIISKKGLSAEVLNELSRNAIAASELIRYSGVLPYRVTWRLANHTDADIRRGVAFRSDVFWEASKKLAEDEPDHTIRQVVAGNVNTPAEVLRYLSYDEEWSVRLLVASNLSTDADVLRKLLLGGGKEYVGYHAAMNPNTTVDALMEAAALPADYDTLDALLSRKDIPLGVVAKVAESTILHNLKNLKKVAVKRLMKEDPQYAGMPAEWVEAAVSGVANA